MEKQNFINAILPGALKGKERGVLPSLTLAQAILESGWGKSTLTQKANNLFGIKAFASWTGKKVNMPTTEYRGDCSPYEINAWFRAYDSLIESIEDHTELLSSTRYAAVRGSKEYKQACIVIRECGYATDPEYSDLLINIIEQNKLYQYDNYVSSSSQAETKVDNKVLELQKVLNRLKIKDGKGNSLAEDGIVGNCTKEATKRLQCICGLTVDGVAGQNTWGAINIILSKPLCGLPYTQKIASRYIQWRVGASIDGAFGNGTAAAVKTWQQSNGLTADGIIGQCSWNKLIG